MAQDKAFCQAIHETFVKDTIEAIKENFESVEGNIKLQSKLNLLSSVIGDEANRCKGTAWRPTNNALNNQAAHDHAALKAAKLKLEQEHLALLEKDVEELQERLSAVSNQLTKNKAQIRRIVYEEEDPSPPSIAQDRC